ncbi:MAG: sterol desaturase family protein [Bacteroidetes bacterium]|nr:sterol desaturase family protein [Bacteroidota bacterium]
MLILIHVLVLAFFFFFMEGVAWFTHKYIMHGFMWIWHKSHHTARNGVFEKNDLFVFVFAIPSFLLISAGYHSGFNWMFFAGLGIAFYGIAYFLVHDVFVHQRISWFKKTEFSYFRAMRRTHYLHHSYHQKKGAEAFGFLFVSKKFRKQFGRG